VRGARYRPFFAAAIAIVALGAGVRAEAPHPVVVFCAPGSPGTSEEAQPTMDAFAAAVSGKAGLPVAATYAPTEDGGVARLGAPDAAVAVVSLPFFLKHEQALGLHAELQAVPQGEGGTERWSLVVRKGRIAHAADLDGFTILSSAGYAPAFVRGTALGAWGRIPGSVRITPSTAVLSALRRAAAGENVAVLLDAAQTAALASLPFAGDVEVVARSPALPAGIVATIGRRLPAARWAKLAAALRDLPSDPTGAAALAGVRMARFAPVDAAALSAARAAHREAAR
jgi:ABC-type phosphate/phosphonate transport system substrate-binding protein